MKRKRFFSIVQAALATMMLFALPANAQTDGKWRQTIIVTNTKSGQTATIAATAADNQHTTLNLSTNELTLRVGEYADVKILSGSGFYELKPHSGKIYDVDLLSSGGSGDDYGLSPMRTPGENGGAYYLRITGVGAGKALVGITDLKTNEYEEIMLTVTNGSDASTVWHLVTENDEQFPMSSVGMLVAVDESAYFSVLDTNGNVLADEVLRVHFVNSDPVSVENITTEKTQNILKRYVDNELTLVGANGTVNVYSVDGVKMLTIDADGQETVINVSSLPSGVYIVKCGNQSFKFNKK